MRPAALDERARALTAHSAQLREGLARALTPMQTRAQEIDGTVERLRRHRGLIGFLGGLGVGLLVAMKPRWFVSSPRAFAALWPAWRLLRWQRDRRATKA